MRMRSGLPVIVALVFLAGGRQVARADAGADKIAQYLDHLGAGGYNIDAIDDDFVTATFPNYHFYAVWFQRYPLTVNPPQGLSPSNIFLVGQGQVIPLTQPEDLKRLFVFVKGSVNDFDAARDTTRTWLRMASWFVQDGFYSFSDPGAVIEDIAIPYPAAFLTEGRIAVTDGGEGGIRVQMEFDQNGHIVDITQYVQVTPGVRPL